MRDDLQRLHDLIGAMFMALAPAVFVIVAAVLLGLALWVARQAWHSQRLLQALATAPLVALHPGATGLVKVRGHARAPAAAPGRAPSSIVWYARSSGRGGDRSTMTSTDNFLIQDATGLCAVPTGQATVLPSAAVHTEGFLGRGEARSAQALYAGDAVFALGALRRDLPPLAGVESAPCRLARQGGVLLVSGGTEREAQVLYALWLLVQAPLALLCLALLGFGAWAHVAGYPPGPAGGPEATFVQSLRDTPWKASAGPDHPLWLQQPSVAPEAQ